MTKSKISEFNIFLSDIYNTNHKGKYGFAFNIVDVDTLKGTTFFNPIEKEIYKLRHKCRKLIIKNQIK